jgi:hypothetical protein
MSAATKARWHRSGARRGIAPERTTFSPATRDDDAILRA